jgi:GntR family transcriptional regulator, arabinose operon transcriptional repressor
MLKPTQSIDANTKLKRVYDLLHLQISSGQFKPGQRLPTEQELAGQLGYSATTVATAMRQLVREGVLQRRKRAGTFLQSRSSPATSFFGAIIYHVMPYYPETVFSSISRQIAHELEADGYSLLVHDPAYNTCETPPEVTTQFKRIARRLINHKVAGVFVLPQEIESEHQQSLSSEALARLQKAKIPVVLLDRDTCRYPQRSLYDIVSIDNTRASYVITEHLLSLGRRRIDFVAPDNIYSSAARDRIEGYKQALMAHGIDPASRTVHYVDMGLESVQKIMRSNADALVIINDGFAARIMRSALSIGRRIPEDLAFVGFDDLPQSERLAVPLTTIRQPVGDFGRQAVLTLFERIKHPDRGPIDVHVPFELIIRRSCGASAEGRKTVDGSV